MMEKNKPELKEIRFDERQILERGKAWRNGYLSLAAAVLAFYFIKDCFEVRLPMNDFSVVMACIWVSAVVFCVTMIVRNAYDGVSDGRNAVAVSAMGAVGLFVLASEIVKGLEGTFVFYSSAGTVITAASLLTICAVYWVKRLRDRKRNAAAEEP